jgi:hypothetical protein
MHDRANVSPSTDMCCRCCVLCVLCADVCRSSSRPASPGRLCSQLTCLAVRSPLAHGIRKVTCIFGKLVLGGPDGTFRTRHAIYTEWCITVVPGVYNIDPFLLGIALREMAWAGHFSLSHSLQSDLVSLSQKKIYLVPIRKSDLEGSSSVIWNLLAMADGAEVISLPRE